MASVPPILPRCRFFDEVQGESLAHSLTAAPVNFNMGSRYLALSALAALVKVRGRVALAREERFAGGGGDLTSLAGDA